MFDKNMKFKFPAQEVILNLNFILGCHKKVTVQFLMFFNLFSKFKLLTFQQKFFQRFVNICQILVSISSFKLTFDCDKNSVSIFLIIFDNFT